MSSYISIGIASNDDEQTFINKCNQVIMKNSIYIDNIVIRYPVSNQCDKWIERNVNINDLKSMLHLCYINEYAEMTIDYKWNNKRIIEGVLVRIRREENKYLGILFEIPEDNFKMEKELDVLEEIITQKIQEILYLGFIYAYCDNETDIEECIEEVLNEDNCIYSILLINRNGKIETKLGSWKIDGLSNREGRGKYSS